MNSHTDYLDGYVELNQEQIAELRTKTLYKLLNKEKCHHGFQYQTGLNIDTISFYSHGDGQPGGLYFADYHNILYNLGFIDNVYWIVEVSLPENVRVYEENVPLTEYGLIYTKYKADKIIISDSQRFDLMTFEFTPELVDYINNQQSDCADLRTSILRYLNDNVYMQKFEKVNTFLYLKNDLKIDLKETYSRYSRFLDREPVYIYLEDRELLE